jgi:hypothetical protein
MMPAIVSMSSSMIVGMPGWIAAFTLAGTVHSTAIADRHTLMNASLARYVRSSCMSRPTPPPDTIAVRLPSDRARAPSAPQHTFSTAARWRYRSMTSSTMST